ncbi:FGGY family of carbohydrate kinase [Dipodascopsis uninucleata]
MFTLLTISCHQNQSSTDIWNSCCYSVKKILEESGVAPSEVKGLGFDATCSLVVIDQKTDEPVAVGPDFNEHNQNIVLWMDHRCPQETAEINATKHKVLQYVGGQMSIEMEIPKVKWLKNHLPLDTFKGCKFYDLADWLTHKATKSETRSFCSVVCKQGYVPVGVDGSMKGWSAEFLDTIDLHELVEDDFKCIGGVLGVNGTILSAGEYLGGLCDEAAKDLGLEPGTAVGSGVIDAYAGWVGTVAAKINDPDWIADADNEDDTAVATSRLAAVAGTSTCHLAMTPESVFVPGVWGPYRDVLLPNMWMAEGGQSATGALLHHVITTHYAYNEALELAKKENISIFEYLNNYLTRLKDEQGLPSYEHLIKHYYFYGDLHGNRSPIASEKMKGAVIGLSMDLSVENLAICYLAAVEFIALQTRHIIQALNDAGHTITSIFLSGGQSRNDILTSLMATATEMPVVIPRYIDAAVVLGSAMLGAKAASHDEKGNTVGLWEIMKNMSQTGRVVYPSKCESETKLVRVKYTIFLDMAKRQQQYRDVVDAVLNGNETKASAIEAKITAGSK